jgi:hypothetical protein
MKWLRELLQWRKTSRERDNLVVQISIALRALYEISDTSRVPNGGRAGTAQRALDEIRAEGKIDE